MAENFWKNIRHVSTQAKINLGVIYKLNFLLDLTANLLASKIRD